MNDKELKDRIAYTIISIYTIGLIALILFFIIHFLIGPLLNPHINGFVNILQTSIFSLPIWIYCILTHIIFIGIHYIRKV